MNIIRSMLNGIFKKLRRGFSKHIKKEDIYIHHDSKIREFTTIGFGTNINGPAYLSSRKNAPITIGRYCAIGFNLRVRVRNHYTGYPNLQSKFQNKYNFPSLASIKGPVAIGNNVWIGDNVIILSGVTIGDGAVIGAGSIVTKDVPPFSIAVGNPAKVIKNRFTDTIIKQLLEIQWWNWSEKRIKRNRRFFETDLTNDDNLDIYSIIVA